MPDDQNSQNNQQNSQNNQDSQNNQQSGNNSGSKKVALGCDINGNDAACQDTVAKVLEGGGYQVEKLAIDPNAFATRSYESTAKGTKGVYLMADSIYSISDLYYGNTSFDYAVFGIRGDLGLARMSSDQDFQNNPIGQDPDCNGDCAKLAGKTYPQINEITKSKCVAVFGKDCQELGQRILEALGGQTSGGSSSGGGAQIKDKTFEHCIRRICAATDSVFLVEGNAAILFPYTDWMAFVLEAKVQTISASEMDPDIFEIEYNSEGFYNKVVGWWGDVEIPDRYIKDDKTGKIIKNPETKAELSEIGKKLTEKYGTSDYASIINKESGEEYIKGLEEYYKKKKIGKTNEVSLENIKKEGDITTKESNLANGGVQIAKQYDPLVDIYGELEKRITTPYPDQETAEYALNALLVQYVRDFNNKCRVRTLNTQKYIGGTFYVVENPFTKKQTLFYLNGYSIRTQKDEPLYIDLDFRYGPEGAEELLDYQFLTGGTGSSGGSTGGKGNEEQIWTEAAKIPYGSCFSSEDPNEAYNHLHGHEGDAAYCTECYGMSSYLYYRFNNEAGIPCQVVGDSGHHVVMLDRGSGFVETREEYRKYNFDYYFKWRENQNTSVLLPAPGGKGNNKTNAKNPGTGGNT